MDLSTLKCPKCGTSIYVEKFIKDGAYICGNKPSGENNGICYKFIGCVCKKCNKILVEEDLGLRGDVYECKTCGTPQWGYTEYKRERAESDAYFNSVMQQLENLRRQFER